jgi:hypothetical protein
LLRELEYISAMRFWLAFILTASFALQGWAATQALDLPCPMEAEMSAAAAQVHGEAQQSAGDVALGDCCNDMATFFLTGQACKTGQDCQVPVSALFMPLATRAAPMLSQTVPVASNPAALSTLLVAVWRPPTSR